MQIAPAHNEPYVNVYVLRHKCPVFTMRCAGLSSGVFCSIYRTLLVSLLAKRTSLAVLLALIRIPATLILGYLAIAPQPSYLFSDKKL